MNYSIEVLDLDGRKVANVIAENEVVCSAEMTDPGDLQLSIDPTFIADMQACAGDVLVIGAHEVGIGSDLGKLLQSMVEMLS